MTTRYCAAILTAVLASCVPGATRVRVESCAAFPGLTWEFRPPSAVGLKHSKLSEVATLIDGHGTIVRDGYMVRTWGTQDLKGNWGSACVWGRSSSRMKRSVVIATQKVKFYVDRQGIIQQEEFAPRKWKKKP
jgi:hypothetical protein